MNYCKQDFVDALYVFSAHFIQFTAFQKFLAFVFQVQKLYNSKFN
jgi:hypothetical protein